MPHESLKNLPKAALRLFESAFRNARARGNSEAVAASIAYEVVRQQFKIKSNVRVIKHAKLKLNLVKSGLIFPKYRFELDLSNNRWDTDDQRISENLLERLASSGNIASIGDVDHERDCASHGLLAARSLINSDVGTEGLYVLENYRYDQGAIKAVVSMNKDHPLFSKYLKLHNQGKFLYASAEFPNATIQDGVVVDSEEMRWSITNTPASVGLQSAKLIA